MASSFCLFERLNPASRRFRDREVDAMSETTGLVPVSYVVLVGGSQRLCRLPGRFIRRKGKSLSNKKRESPTQNNRHIRGCLDNQIPNHPAYTAEFGSCHKSVDLCRCTIVSSWLADVPEIWQFIFWIMFASLYTLLIVVGIYPSLTQIGSLPNLPRCGLR
jgi:hypothetical protein